MNTQDDKLIQNFFQQNKKEIPDIFFSRKVMQKLPVRSGYDWIIIMLTGLASLLSFLFGGNVQLPELQLPDIIITIPAGYEYYLLGAIFLFPFFGLLFFFLKSGKSVKLI